MRGKHTAYELLQLHEWLFVCHFQLSVGACAFTTNQLSGNNGAAAYRYSVQANIQFGTRIFTRPEFFCDSGARNDSGQLVSESEQNTK